MGSPDETGAFALLPKTRRSAESRPSSPAY